MFLIAAEVVKMEDPVAELEALGLYMATVLTGLAIHGFIILPLLYFAVVRKNPYKYIYGLLQAMATALGTASRYTLFLWLTLRDTDSDPIWVWISIPKMGTVIGYIWIRIRVRVHVMGTVSVQYHVAIGFGV